ncbi:urea ABC transporter permease subunit UrtB [Nocardioides seonyuensis]|uniref:Urea ABC transporter permease subunit UrtB n=1 Tax=Nocardioides seonyuensis TaxID=2518371 RepID=A0A4P7II05_9ACTN|nr:urea ABC transporter permease subunit UrtB [Nocardioides seonyuensis]QBX56300.1 urea ABC transporter permease subunit UrtB [Nocardioides seonyuensis]
MESFTTPLLTGASTGAILLVAALGLALTFGQMGVINMAHGEFLMAGAYSAYLTQQVVADTTLSLLLAIPVAFAVAGLLGLVLEAGVIRWMYHRPLDTLLVTVGVSLVLQQLAKDLFGAQGDSVFTPGWLDGHLTVLGYNWPYVRMFTIVVALASLAALAALLKFTSLGRRIRATVQNRELAETMGVATRSVDRLTFFVGSGLAGLGGVAVALSGGTNPGLGTTYIIPAFLVVVAGGLGQLRGTVIAAFVVGIVIAYLTRWFDASMAQVIIFALVVVFLQLRPQGLFTVQTRGLA